MKKVTITFSKSDLGFLRTSLSARIYDYKSGNVPVPDYIADSISKELQVLLDRINFELESISSRDN